MFKRLKKGKGEEKLENKTEGAFRMTLRNYPPKVILALAEAINGNEDALVLLNKAGYEELVMLDSAIKLRNEARDWLLQNNYPHLMAFVNTIEGQEKAGNWLRAHKFDLYFFAGLAGDGRIEGYVWLEKEGYPEWLLLCKRIQDLKDNIEERHNDLHFMGE